jgi:hypothetical protein
MTEEREWLGLPLLHNADFVARQRALANDLIDGDLAIRARFAAPDELAALELR